MDVWNTLHIIVLLPVCLYPGLCLCRCVVLKMHVLCDCIDDSGAGLCLIHLFIPFLLSDGRVDGLDMLRAVLTARFSSC